MYKWQQAATCPARMDLDVVIKMENPRGSSSSTNYGTNWFGNEGKKSRPTVFFVMSFSIQQ
jgi:hypothetical protein